jgi:lipoprotein-releasing system ATP-binding protein
MNKIESNNLSKSFFIDGVEIKVLNKINISIKRGDLIALSGKSGAGKSTLLQILASLDTPSSGSIKYDDTSIRSFNNTDLSSLRLNNFGFVYQFHHLLEDLTVIENILIPLEILNKSINKLEVSKIIDEVGLSHRLNHHPWRLSGGEKQRVAIARALTNKPNFIFLDEPTGNLDEENAAIIQKLLLDISRKYNIALITATHDSNFIRNFDKIYKIQDMNLTEV